MTKEFTQEDIKKYISSDGTNCPYCGVSGSVVADDIAVRNVKVHCEECDMDWYDLYIMVGFADDNNEYTTGQVEGGIK